jgi:predicted cupin superfamily sugar epimerase
MAAFYPARFIKSIKGVKSMQKPTIQQIIDLFHLEPLPIEGGLFTQTYCSPETIDGQALPERFHGTQHTYGTSILFLFTTYTDYF